MTSDDLERRLRQVYNSVQTTAEQRLRRAQRRFNQFVVSPDVPLQHQEAAARMWFMRIDYEQRIIESMAADIARAGDIATRMIDAESFNWFSRGYNATMNNIKRDLSLSVRNHNRGVLQAIYNGNATQLGQMQGFMGSFEQAGHRQYWQRMAGDRRRGRYYFDRASKRLGHDPAIVGRLRDSLTQSVLLGESIPQMATRIRRVTDSCRYQAVRIARTEMNRAAAQSRMLASFHAESLGIRVIKKWLATKDERTRDSHAHMNGETAENGQPFSNGLQYPGDPAGDASEIVNCRCQVVHVVQGVPTSQNYRDLVEQVDD